MIKRIFAILSLVIAISSCSDSEPQDLLSELDSPIYASTDDPDAKDLGSPLNAYKARKFNITETKSFKYRILPPNDIVAGQKYPLIIYLHGKDHRGSDNSSQLHYLAHFFLKHHIDFPAYVIYPQCPTDAYWSLTKRPSDFNPHKMPIAPKLSYVGLGLIKLIEELGNTEQVDLNRVYIMGHSMGGIGTLDIITRYPNMFAGAVAFCGTINPLRFDSSTNVPIFLVHNADDSTITVEGSREAYKRLKELSHTVVYQESSTGGHVCWNTITQTNQLLKWIFNFTSDRQ